MNDFSGSTPAPPPDVPVIATGVLARVDRGAADVLLTGASTTAPDLPALGTGVDSDLGTDARVRADLGARVLADAAADYQLQPVVGDDVRLVHLPEGRWLVDALLPRRTAITRASVAPGSSHRQVLAANVDFVAVTEPVDARPKPGRVERLLALAWESGATPLVLLTKSDLAHDLDESTETVVASAPGVDVIVCSATTGEGVDVLAALLQPEVSIAFVGPSGAGKSSLVNALAGGVVMDVGDVRSDHRGRHTTVHRELVVLPGGARVVDTPGLRSVGLTTTDALDQVFSDIEEYAASCRFGDCQHETEPGCGVTSAIEAGLLDERRLASWRKLQREAAWLERRNDARKRAEERARWKSLSKQMRNSPRTRH